MSFLQLTRTYKGTETDSWIGMLKEARNVLVTKERHGIYELTFDYPTDGFYFSYLKCQRWVIADAGTRADSKAQRFQISTITKKTDGTVSIYCEHYSGIYSYAVLPVKTASPYTTAFDALTRIKGYSYPSDVMTYVTTDVTTEGTFTFANDYEAGNEVPKFATVREALGGKEGSVLDVFGGEYIFDNSNVKFLTRAGRDTDVAFALGRNIISGSYTESIESVYTSVMGIASLPELEIGSHIRTKDWTYAIVDAADADSWEFRRAQVIDFTESVKNGNGSFPLKSDGSYDIDEINTRLTYRARKYITTNGLGRMQIAVDAEIIDLLTEFVNDQIKELFSIDLCDTIVLSLSEIGVNIRSKIVKTVWDVTLDRYQSIELDTLKKSLADVIK